MSEEMATTMNQPAGSRWTRKQQRRRARIAQFLSRIKLPMLAEAVWCTSWRCRWGPIRRWLLEHDADKGLGGPPNNWAHLNAFRSCGWGMAGDAEWSAYITNDAGEVSIARRFSDEIESSWALMVPAPDFRRIAAWYLFRWAWGEWFGVRRWLYFKWLHRHVARTMRGR